MNIILMFVLTSLFWACEKTEPLPVDSIEIEQKNTFELIWSSRMDFDKEIVNLANGESYQDWYLKSGDDDDPPKVMAFNKSTGEKDWEIYFEQMEGNEITYMFVQDDILIARNSYTVFAIDLKSRTLLWEDDLKAKGLRLDRGTIAANGKYYQLADFGFGTALQVRHLIEFDIASGAQRTVYTKAADNQGIYASSPPAYFFDQKGNRELLIFNEYPNALVAPPESIQNLLAIDLKTKEVIWKVEKFTNNFYSNSLHPPVVYDHLIITGGDWSIYAFDIYSGKQIWKYEENTAHFASWNNTNHLIVGDKLFINSGDENVSCLNPNTGALIWNNPKGGPKCSDNMIYYEKEDLLVFTSWGYGSVMVLDGLSGETFHREHRYDNSQYNNDVVYDQEKDMFFTSTYKHAMGFKIARPRTN